jgi:hypothetical protein
MYQREMNNIKNYSGKNNQFICSFCDKKLENKTKFEQHLIICELITRETQDNEKNDYHDFKPSNTLLFNLIKSLILKNNKLENEVESMKKIINKEKKKINILDWLNKNYIYLSIDIHKWCDNIIISQKELDYFFNNNYIQGLLNIFKNNLLLENEEHHPIKCFNERKLVFFKYEEETKWTILEYDDFNKILTKINYKLIKQFNEWRIENQDKIDNDDHFNDIFLKYRRIVLGENKSRFDVIRLIKSKLYQYLKLNLKKIIDYEYTI